MAFSLIRANILLASNISMSCRSISNVTVIGAGLMGSGIAQVAAQTGHKVVVSDISNDLLKNSSKIISKSLDKVAKKQFPGNAEEATKFIQETQSRLSFQTNAEEAVKNADIVVEAIVENIGIKHELFKTLDKAAPARTIFTSNTSSLSIENLASVTKRKDKFGGLHFFNPPPVMKLLEVIRTKQTSDETYAAMLAFGKKLGKTTIPCRDTPGFVVNRLIIPYVAEAMRMLERGDASAKDIDLAMKLGAGYIIGPIELMDVVGLDTGLFILEGWHERFPENELFRPPAILKKLVAEGKLGRKTGEGFYKHN